jgi:hypothetical protein
VAESWRPTQIDLHYILITGVKVLIKNSLEISSFPCNAVILLIDGVDSLVFGFHKHFQLVLLSKVVELEQSQWVDL